MKEIEKKSMTMQKDKKKILSFLFMHHSSSSLFANKIYTPTAKNLFIQIYNSIKKYMKTYG